LLELELQKQTKTSVLSNINPQNDKCEYERSKISNSDQKLQPKTFLKKGERSNNIKNMHKRDKSIENSKKKIEEENSEVFKTINNQL